jgi:hypothetical protein
MNLFRAPRVLALLAAPSVTAAQKTIRISDTLVDHFVQHAETAP